MSASSILSPVDLPIKARARADRCALALDTALSTVPDRDFLTQYALSAQGALGVDYFMISRLNPYSNLMRTLVFVVDGKIVDNVIYSLDGTPCAHAANDGACVYPEDVAKLFPHDRFLHEHAIVGYAGAPLRTASGETLGVSLALTRKPISEPEALRIVLERFAPRTTACIETMEHLERLEQAISTAAEGVWDWDIRTGGIVIFGKIRATLEGSKGVVDLSHLEKAMHPDDRAAHASALRAHLNSGAPYDIAVRLKGRNGDYRWFHTRGEVVRDSAGQAMRMIGVLSDIHDVLNRTRGASPAP